MRVVLRLGVLALAGLAFSGVAWAQRAADEVQQIAQEFGGIYQDPELGRYIASVGQLLTAASDAPDRIKSVNVLDSDIINAFAVPSGHVFVTRGLIALANDEAELASVLGHEIGHVTAEHGESRQTRGILSQLGAGLLGILLDSPDLGQLAGAGAQLYLQKYSRDQEFEADTLGIRFMARAGYDPRASAAFLKSLEASSRLEGVMTGSPRGDAAYSIMADHPRTVDRVQRAVEVAGVNPQPVDAMTARDIYLRKIDGILYGDNPDQGVVRNRVYLHPKLRFAFEVPSGFQVNNGAAQVAAQNQAGATLVFDRNPKPFRGPPEDYIRSAWAANARLSALERLDINGLPAATALTQAQLKNGGTADVRLVAIRFDADTIYRFMFLSPPRAGRQFDAEFRRTAMSFRRLSEKEASAIRPLRVRVVTVRQGDTVDSLAARMQVESYRRERFLVLNALPESASLRAGDQVKIVEEARR